MKKTLLSYIKSRKFTLCASVVAILGMNSFTAAALPVTYYAETSKLSEGKWVRIKTTGEGMHQISYDSLREWGFPEPEKVNVYGYPATILATEEFDLSHPDDVVMTYTVHDGNKLFFYSGGEVSTPLSGINTLNINLNYYSRDVYYLLSDRTPDASELPVDVDCVEKDSFMSNHLSVSFFKESLQNPAGGGAYFIGQTIEKGETADVDFNIKNIQYGGRYSWDNAYVRMGFGALNKKNQVKMTVTCPASVYNTKEDPTPAKGASLNDPHPAEFTLGNTLVTFTDRLADGTYTFKANYSAENPTFMALDYAYIIYPRSNKASDDAEVIMNFYNVDRDENLHFVGPSTMRFINVAHSGKTFGYKTLYDETESIYTVTLSLPDGMSKVTSEKIVAFDLSKPQKEVVFDSYIANQNLHAEKTPDILIITTDELEPCALDLAQLHRSHEGKDVLVVEHKKIFNEFSSATPEIMGYRRFIKMLYDRDPSKLKHIILYGRSHWDNRCISAVEKDRLLIYETTDPEYSACPTKNFGTDSYLGLMDDNYKASNILSAQQQIAVGRIPALNEGTGFDLNKKVKSFFEQEHKARYYGKVLLASDKGDGNIHLTQSEGVARILGSERESLSLIRAYNSIMPHENGDAKELRRIITDAFDKGVGMFSYVGHGSYEAFGAETIWNINYAQKTDYDIAPLGVFATCWAFNIDNDVVTLGSEMLEKANGGLMSVIGAGREVYANLNSTFVQEVAREYAKADASTTYGEIWLRARNRILNNYPSKDLRVNTLCYNLGGNPALSLYAPGYKVKITETSVEDGGIVDALAMQTLKGEIVGSDGKIATDFNGTMTMEIYDAPYNVDVIIRGQGDSEGSITLEQDLLLTKEIEIKDGKFTATFAAPVPMHEGTAYNRVTFYADATDGRRADGLLKTFSVKASATPAEGEMGDAPVIDSFMVMQTGNDADLMNADTKVRFIASGTLSAIGINTSDAIGAASSLVIDDVNKVSNFAQQLIVDDNTGTWKVNAEVAVQNVGNHTATLNVIDNAGRHASQTITFALGNGAPIELTADRTSVRSDVTFDVASDLSGKEHIALVIEDRTGNRVYYGENPSFPCKVDMSAIEGVADGHYKAYVKARGADGSMAASEYLPLTFVKK